MGTCRAKINVDPQNIPHSYRNLYYILTRKVFHYHCLGFKYNITTGIESCPKTLVKLQAPPALLQFNICSGSGLLLGIRQPPLT